MADIIKGQSKTAAHTIRATVARGRTVMVADGESEVVGYGPDGKPLMSARKRAYQFGEEVTLPAQEVEHFRKLGYLIDPDVKEVPREGTSINEGDQEGPRVHIGG